MRIALIDNGVAGLGDYYVAGPGIEYRRERITARWQPDFSADDVLLAPNGTDHVALYEARNAVHALLARGGAVLCFCGFFTPWLPGSQWRHDIGAPLGALRYALRHDALALFEGVEPEALCQDAHGIRGGWACGTIVTAHPTSVVLVDNFARVLMIADQRTTPGLIIATASGPVWDEAPTRAASGVRHLYRNILRACQRHLETRHA